MRRGVLKFYEILIIGGQSLQVLISLFFHSSSVGPGSRPGSDSRLQEQAGEVLLPKNGESGFKASLTIQRHPVA